MTSRSWCARALLSVRDAILIGLVLACIILFLFLHDWTSSLVAGLVIPVTVAVTILFLRITGQSFNLMTLGGLAAAIGLVIDDAIVVVENIAVHREAGESRTASVRKAIHEISQAAGLFHHHAGHRLSSPGRGHPGHGKLLPRPCRNHDGCVAHFACCSPLPSPQRSALGWRRKRHGCRPRKSLLPFFYGKEAKRLPCWYEADSHGTALPTVVEATTRTHRRAGDAARLQRPRTRVDLALTRPIALAAVCLALVGLPGSAINALGSDLLPEMDEGAFILDYFTPAGTSLSETNRILEHVEQILRSIARGSRSPRAAPACRWVWPRSPRPTPETSRCASRRTATATSKRSWRTFANRIHAKPSPPLDMEFTQILQDMIGDLSNSPEPIQIKLFSNDADPAQPARPQGGSMPSRRFRAWWTPRTAWTTPSPARPPTSRWIPDLAGRLGFTPERGCRRRHRPSSTACPPRAHDRQRPPLHHPRPSAGCQTRASLEARSRTRSSTPAAGHTAYAGFAGAGDPASAAE